jgi:hypothetical protein
MSRISKERMEKALEQLKTISETDYAKVKASQRALWKVGCVNVNRVRSCFLLSASHFATCAE